MVVKNKKGGNMPILSGILGLIIFALDIIAIIDCAKRNMDTGKKILWIVLIIVLPVIGLILYFLLGRGK